MPVYKDESRGTWFVKVAYADYTGQRRQKMKRGFQLRKDALKWEREFLEQMAGAPTMTFSALYSTYLEYVNAHKKKSSAHSIMGETKKHILPVFGDTPIKDITPAKYMAWQNQMMSSGLAIGTLFRIDGIFRTILNYAVKYCGLARSPAAGIPRIGKNKSKEMQFYTVEQFNCFIKTFDEDDPFRVVYLVLFYTGLRVGELLALTPADIDITGKNLCVRKTWDSRTHILTTPKTEKSNRVVSLPSFLVDELERYMSHFYALTDDTRLFPYTQNRIYDHLRKHARIAKLPIIRTHDLRHSHASLLINMGMSPAVIADRLGHESAQITLTIYAHLYPDKQRIVAAALEELHSAG